MNDLPLIERIKKVKVAPWCFSSKEITSILEDCERQIESFQLKQASGVEHIMSFDARDL